MRCLRCIVHVQWQERFPNTEFVQICGITSIKAFLLSSQLCWTRYVHVSDDRLPQIIFYGQLSQGARSHAGQLRQLKNVVKANLKVCCIEPNELEILAADRPWHGALCCHAVHEFESYQVSTLQARRMQHKTCRSLTDGDFSCDIRDCICHSRISMFFHLDKHICNEIHHI